MTPKTAEGSKAKSSAGGAAVEREVVAPERCGLQDTSQDTRCFSTGTAAGEGFTQQCRIELHIPGAVSSKVLFAGKSLVRQIHLSRGN